MTVQQTPDLLVPVPDDRSPEDPEHVARLIAAAGNLVRSRGWVPFAGPGCKGIPLSLAVCQRAGCSTGATSSRRHAEACTAAKTRLAGYLCLHYGLEAAGDDLPAVLGHWEQSDGPLDKEPTAAGQLRVILAVADGTAESLGLKGHRHNICGYWGEGPTGTDRAADYYRHTMQGGCRAA